MPDPVGGPKLTSTQAIGVLEKTPGYQDLARLGQQALDALVAGTGDAGRSRELIGAIQVIASEVAKPAAPVAPGRPAPSGPNLDEPKAILAHIAAGARDVTLSVPQATALETFVKRSIAEGGDLAAIAAAAKNMGYGVPSREAPGGLSHVGGNFGSQLQRTIVDAFKDAGHDVERFGLDDIGAGLDVL